MNTNTVVWISLSCIWLILFIMNLKFFFFHRTKHKIHQYTGLSMESLRLITPSSYLIINTFSTLRWVVLIALFFYNWIAAIVCLAIEFILPIILPEEDDYKNIVIMRNELKKRGGFKELDDILKEIMEKM